MGPCAAGPSLAEAPAVPSFVPAGARCLGPDRRPAARAVRHGFLPRGGRGRPRGGGRTGACGDHRTGPLPLPVPRRGGAAPGDFARLPAPRHRTRAAWRSASAHHPSPGNAGGRHHHRPCPGLLPGPGGAGGLPGPRPGPVAAGRRPGTGAPGEPHGRSRRAGGGCGFPADGVLLRPAPRRFPEHDRVAVRQPLRARLRAPRRRRVRCRPPAAGRPAHAAGRGVSRHGRSRQPALGNRLGHGALREHRRGGRSRRGGTRTGWSRGPGQRPRTGCPPGFSFGHLPICPTAGFRLRQRGCLRPRLCALAGDPAVRRIHPRTRGRTAGRARPRPLRAAGRFARYKVVDPSFHNWPGLALALRHQPISDFPLCNKSFNLSYGGHDL